MEADGVLATSNDDLRKQVELANKKFYQALASCSIQSMDDIWMQGADALCIHPGWPPLIGWESVRESWVRIFQNTQMHKIEIENIVIQARQDSGWITCIEKIGTVTGTQIHSSYAISTNIFILSDSKWKIVLHQGYPIEIGM